MCVTVLTDLLQKYTLRTQELKIQCDDKLFNVLSRQITRFELLASNLGLTRSQIVEIGRDKDNERSRIMETLWKWRERNGSTATYLALIEVFIEDENIESAEFILNHYNQQVKQETMLLKYQDEVKGDYSYHGMLSTKATLQQCDWQSLPNLKPRHPSSVITRTTSAGSIYKQNQYRHHWPQSSKYRRPTLPWNSKGTCSQSPFRTQDYGQFSRASSSKIVGQLNPNNPFSQIFDKFYDKIVTIISQDINLSNCFMESLNAKFFLPTTLRKQSYWDLLPCLAIKNKALVESVSTFISRTRTPDKSLFRLVNLLEQLPKLKSIAEEIRQEASSLGNVITMDPITKASEERTKHFKIPKESSFSDEHHEMDLPESPANHIKTFARHLLNIYKHWHPDLKWSPTKIKIFVDLAIIESSLDYDDEFSRSTLHGSIDDICKRKRSISIDDLCKIPCSSSILIEGAPGIGKSVLAFELCRRWFKKEEILQHYSLLLLLRLRDKNVQNNLSSVEELLGCFLHSQSWKQLAIQDIIDNSGEGVMIILDGYDELPDEVPNNGNILDQIMQSLPLATVIVTNRPSVKRQLTERINFTHHIEVLGFTKDSRTEYIRKFFKGDEVLHEKFHQYIKCFHKLNEFLYVPINLVIILDIFQNSLVDSSTFCLPKTMTELYDTLVRTLIYRHLKDTNIVNFKSLKELPQPALSTFQNLCKLAYDGIFNKQQLVFYCQESFETLGLMQKESQMLPSEGGDVFVYSFLHLTIQEFLAAYYVHENQQEVDWLFSSRNYVSKFAITMRFLAGLTKLESAHFPVHVKLYNCNIFHQFFEAKNDALTSKLLSRQIKLKIARLSPIPTPLDMYMIGRCIALGQCQWELGFTLRGVSSDHLEMFTSGLNSTGEVKGQIEHISLSLNSLGNNISSCLLKIPKYILNNLCSLLLRGIEVDVCCLDNLVLAIPNLISLKKFLFHDNYFKEGEQKHFIEILCCSKSLQHVSFSTLSPDECVTLLTSSHTLRIIELYQLLPPSIEAVIKSLSNTTTLSDLHIHQSEVKADFIDNLSMTLPSSHLKSLKFINCAIDSVTVYIIADAVMRCRTIEKLDLSDNLIGDEGGHYLADMIHSLIGAEYSKKPAADIIHQLNEVYLDHNPFTNLTIFRFMDVLISCHPRSLLNVHLSLEWKDYIESLPTYSRVKKRIHFERKDDYN